MTMTKISSPTRYRVQISPLAAAFTIAFAALAGCAYAHQAPGQRAAVVRADADGAGQFPVPVGKGSYASTPPDDKNIDKILGTTPRIVDPGDRPIPTNKWWTNLLIDRFVGQLWAFPQMLKSSDKGLQFFYPIKWNESGRDPVSDSPLDISGVDFQPTGTAAKTWGDWNLTFRISESPIIGAEGQESANRYIDVTLARGVPYAWFEYHGTQPLIESSDDAQYFDDRGQSVSFPYASDHFGMTFGGRSYGVFAPDGATFLRDGRRIALQTGQPNSYLVVAALPDPSDLALFEKYAYAIPRGTRMDWSYDPDKALVSTKWHLITEPLKGTERRLIQGWLPHHYRDTTNDLDFTGFTYLTPRGTMKCAVGDDFAIDYPFNGIIPFLPAPQQVGLPHDFDEGRMRDYLSRYATRTKYGDDTYWGGKSLVQYADYMAMAREMHDPSFETLKGLLRTALVDWYTYTPGEDAHYFARYSKWHALIGIKPSYGSEAFNDNHFHYGYFTRSTAMLGFFDPRFLADYGPMARLVAKEYVNWDRTDTRFPFLRTFDIWEGHSWAGGTSGPTGNNQESSSEAVQSWGGLYLLGIALHDKDMTAAGAMGYAMETHAALEYWFNIHGDNFSPNYQHPISGMVWDGGVLYGTYFSGDPAWIFAINWLPNSTLMSYLVRDPDFARKNFHTMMDEQLAKKGTNDIAGMGTGLGNVVLAQAAQINPDWVAEEMDDLWASNSPVAHDNDTPGNTYYMAHAYRMLGEIQWDYHMSLPTSCVYHNSRTGVTTYAAFNPYAETRTVVVYRGEQKIGSLRVPAKTLLTTSTLQPLK